MNDIIVSPTTLPADQNPATLYLARLSKGSVRTQQTALNEIAGSLSNGKLNCFTFPWHQLNYQRVQLLRTYLLSITEFKTATVNRYLSAVRGVLKEAWKLGLMDSETYMRAVDVENAKSQELPAGRMLAQSEIKSLIQACALSGGATKERDMAIIGMMYITGMRRSEVCKLNMEDYDATTGEIRIIAGKGNKSRTSYVAGHAKRFIDEWLQHRGFFPGALFLTVDHHGNLTDKPLNAQTLYDTLQKRSQQAGIKSFSPHDLRRTAISEMLERGVDISTVAKIVGHSRLDTTRRYDRRDEETKKAVAKLFDLPL